MDLKELDIHKDYTLWALLQNFKSELHIICSYMQNTTPYGTEYENAFQKSNEIYKSIEELESLLQDCVEVRGK